MKFSVQKNHEFYSWPQKRKFIIPQTCFTPLGLLYHVSRLCKNYLLRKVQNRKTSFLYTFSTWGLLSKLPPVVGICVWFYIITLNTHPESFSAKSLTCSGQMRSIDVRIDMNTRHDFKEKGSLTFISYFKWLIGLFYWGSTFRTPLPVYATSCVVKEHCSARRRYTPCSTGPLKTCHVTRRACLNRASHQLRLPWDSPARGYRAYLHGLTWPLGLLCVNY